MTVLPDPRPGPEKQAALVQQMFDRVAPRYDLANSVLSLGQDRHWRRVTVAAVRPRPGEVILDAAAGTGPLAAELAAAGASAIALDFSWNMVRTGAERQRDRGLLWCNGDATRLPLADGAVDAVTIGFGLRNLPDTSAGLRELARVTRPGGRLAVLEFSTPVWPPFAAVYTRYLTRLLPLMARFVTSDPAAYRYLADSIRAWPDADGLARRIADAGWTGVRYKRLSGGIVALHHALRAR
ncbi:MAG TPA: class I SAM-dependent methyltransferase [Egibacteraceae bacterium]|nr:class I SAM-dependent methyltransferase [Egibacteraceae bacterium]